MKYLNRKFTDSEVRNLQIGTANLPDQCTFGTLGAKSRSTYEMAPAGENKEYGQKIDVGSQSSMEMPSHNRNTKSGSTIVAHQFRSVSSIRSVSPIGKRGTSKKGDQNQDFVLFSTRMKPAIRHMKFSSKLG